MATAKKKPRSPAQKAATRKMIAAAGKARKKAAPKRASRSNGALSPSELTALRAYARKHGRTWKAALRDDWMYATAPAELMRLRSRLGPGWLTTYRLPAASTRSNGAAKRR